MPEDRDVPVVAEKLARLPGEVNNSPTKLDLPEWLEALEVVEVPAIELFRAKDEFLPTEMSSRRWVNGVGEVRPNLTFFQEFLDSGGIEEPAILPVRLRPLRLLEMATSEAIVAELGGEASVVVTIGQIVQFLRQGEEFRVGDCFLFFARGRSRVLRPITCVTKAHWGDVNREILARRIDDVYRWNRGWQVVSR